MSIEQNLLHIKSTLPESITLVAVSKTKPVSDLMEAYNAGQRIFGENKIQEMVEKREQMPKDIEWHMIGHVQTNKVKFMAPFVHLIHGVDSLKLLEEINKQAQKNNRIIDCLLQIHIAEEESKFGLDEAELATLLSSPSFQEMKNIRITGLMGMATFTDNQAQIQKEFTHLKMIFDELRSVQTRFIASLSCNPEAINNDPEAINRDTEAINRDTEAINRDTEAINRDTEAINRDTERDAMNRVCTQILSMGMSSDYQLAIDCGSTMVRIGSSIFGNRKNQ